MKQIRIGTCLNGETAAKVIPQIIHHGFEAFELNFWQTTGNVDLAEMAKQVREVVDEHGAVISSIGVFGNPLTADGSNADTLASWERLIDHAHLFGANLVGGFTGRLPDCPIDQSMKRFAEVFAPLAKRAEDRGIRLVFENCHMEGTWNKGDWNIAHNPTAWEMMFNALPVENIGLQWEPCHQMLSLIDPIPQLRKWAPKIFSVHGKDATIAWDIVKEYGVHGPKEFAWHRTPGFGDSNWSDIITILQLSNYTGTIDIEGFHDWVYGNDLEMTGQVHALNYLKNCQGGRFIPNPEGF
ncbi:sugar phosphate isomerase/epimerase [Paenibacillus psychroresistens]|uniref:Sugar phosphate isomerase/epimerase n=1 Tax=Paenibacillus psychroresistens TaxID=1778678 RepID=A0A6B8RWL5_9BACL|nr:sugar phosphate isomerase/epimerase family protein [Paenibacillus psychroresistens]QGQ99478.1 sugar phosphate isomerase/epimerase [Paenibacillus psychroresistens]